MRNIIILIVLYAVLIVLGLRVRPVPGIYSVTPVTEKTQPSQQTEGGGAEEKPIYVTLDPVVVNMIDPRTGLASKRSARVGITIQVKSLETANEFKRQTIQTRDCLVGVLSTYTAERLKDPGERLKLKDELIMRLQGIVGENSIININICELVVS